MVLGTSLMVWSSFWASHSEATTVAVPSLSERLPLNMTSKTTTSLVSPARRSMTSLELNWYSMSRVPDASSGVNCWVA